MPEDDVGSACTILATVLGRHYTESQTDQTFSSTTMLQQAATAVQQVMQDSLGDARACLDSMMNYQGKVGAAMLQRFDVASKAWTEQVQALGDTNALMSFIVTTIQVLADRSIFKAMIVKVTCQGLHPIDMVTTVGQGPVMRYPVMAAMAIRLDATPALAAREACAHGPLSPGSANLLPAGRVNYPE